MIEKIKVTRTELIRLKKVLKSYERVHRILKDQYEILIRKFIELIKELKKLEEEYNKTLEKIKENNVLASSFLGDIFTSIIFLDFYINYEIKAKNIYGTKILEGNIDIKIKKFERYLSTPILNEVGDNIKKFISLIFKIAILKENIKRIGETIRETKKRVNLLEKDLIPKTKLRIRLIRLLLDDYEREEKSKIIFIKERILNK